MRRRRRLVGFAAAVAIVLVLAGAGLLGHLCVTLHEGDVWKRVALVPSGDPNDSELTLVTGYCNCSKCCGWRRRWGVFGTPVYNYGPMKGQPKKIGLTAHGTMTRLGTVAADPSQYKFGTHLEIPGYGEGVVEDVGGAIKGRHIDVWFPSHAAARVWGSRWLKVVPKDATGKRP